MRSIDLLVYLRSKIIDSSVFRFIGAMNDELA